MLEVDIEKRMGDFTLSVSFTAGNQVLALLGGSGSGKSMTLRCIAGVERPDRGRIVVDDVVFYDSEKRINLTPQKRQAGLLFQNYALFPTMTVLENIMRGIRGGSRAERRAQALAAVERYRLEGLEKQYPSELSGGQQQRVALARILVGRPRILMLDEPFSALDSHLRDQMEREVRELLGAFAGTTLLVSHSRDEVFRMADRVAVYNSGRIDALDEKHALFRNPGTYFSALLTGCKNFSRAADRSVRDETTAFLAEDWGIRLTARGQRDGSVAAVRGHHIRRARGETVNVFSMEVTDVIEDTFEHVLLLRKPGTDLGVIQWMIPKGTMDPLPAGVVSIHIPPDAVMLLRGELP